MVTKTWLNSKIIDASVIASLNIPHFSIISFHLQLMQVELDYYIITTVNIKHITRWKLSLAK